MFFKKTTEKLNNTIQDTNKVINEIGKNTNKLLKSSTNGVEDFSNKTNAVIWTIVGCIAMTTITNFILLGVTLKMGHRISPASAATESIRIVLGRAVK